MLQGMGRFDVCWATSGLKICTTGSSKKNYLFLSRIFVETKERVDSLSMIEYKSLASIDDMFP
jgi:hypothetical protein